MSEQENRYVDHFELGRRITAAREAKKLTKADVAKAIDVSDVSIYHWESGKNTDIGWKKLVRLADFLELPLVPLLTINRDLQ